MSISSLRKRQLETLGAAALVIGSAFAGAQEEVPSRDRFASALEVARGLHEAAVAKVERDYTKRMAALEAASASLTREARERLAAGPLRGSQTEEVGGAESCGR